MINSCHFLNSGVGRGQGGTCPFPFRGSTYGHHTSLLLMCCWPEFIHTAMWAAQLKLGSSVMREGTVGIVGQPAVLLTVGRSQSQLSS